MVRSTAAALADAPIDTKHVHLLCRLYSDARSKSWWWCEALSVQVTRQRGVRTRRCKFSCYGRPTETVMHVCEEGHMCMLHVVKHERMTTAHNLWRSLAALRIFPGYEEAVVVVVRHRIASTDAASVRHDAECRDELKGGGLVALGGGGRAGRQDPVDPTNRVHGGRSFQSCDATSQPRTRPRSQQHPRTISSEAVLYFGHRH
jgi:hypothetical protein